MSRQIRIFAFWALFLAACAPSATLPPFVPPTARVPLIEPTLIIPPTEPILLIESTPLPTIVPTVNPAECTNDLTFVSDLTVPDNSFVPYGNSIDKQWQVENSGTCHWNAAYRLRHIGGAALDAPEEIALYPARAGTQVTLQVAFIAPFTDGEYESAWQAIDPSGQPFGDPIFMRIIVQP